MRPGRGGAGCGVTPRCRGPALAGEASDNEFAPRLATVARRRTALRIVRIEGMDPIVTSNPKVMHGTPCFAGTRVAVLTFFDHLEAGYTIDEFLEQFPTVGREQVVRLLELLREDAARVAVRA